MRSTMLIVATAHTRLGTTGAPTGCWREEFAVAYMRFRRDGAAVVISTPDRRPSLIDPARLAEPWISRAGRAFLEYREGMALVSEAMAVGDVELDGIDGALLVGGTSAIFDFPHSKPLADQLTLLAVAAKPIASICHGAAGSLGARLQRGAPLVQGRRVTCFSEAEDLLLGYDKILPLLPERALVA